MPTAVGFDPSVYTSTVSTGFTLGAVYSYQDKLYRFVHVNTANLGVGAVVCAYNSTNGEVIGANRTTALAGTPAAATTVGVIPVAVNAGSYCFAQVSGNAVHISGTSTLGRWQMAIATNDTAGDATASLARTDSLLGICVVATSGGFATTQLRGLV